MLPRSFVIPLGWGDLVRRTVRETIDDDCLTAASALAYYFFLALFPAILVLLSVASFFPLQTLTDDLARVLGRVASPEALRLIQDQMQRLANAESGGLLTVGVLGAVWSSSAALVSIVSSLNRAYDVDESRPWWKVRLIAIGLTFTLAVFVLASLTLVLAGPTLARYIAGMAGLGEAFEWSWTILQWPVAFLLVSTALGLVYYVAPDVKQAWVWITPGAVLGTALWLVSSLAFKFYVARFTDYNAAYGAVGAVIVLLLWFYVSGLAILVGAEMNSEIAHAAASQKAARATVMPTGPAVASPSPRVIAPVAPPSSGGAMALVVVTAWFATRAWRLFRR